MEGKMPGGESRALESMLLADVAGDGTFAVDSIYDRDARNLKLMETCGITPGARLQVRRNPGRMAIR